jgi:hypothetical protein
LPQPRLSIVEHPAKAAINTAQHSYETRYFDFTIIPAHSPENTAAA